MREFFSSYTDKIRACLVKASARLSCEEEHSNKAGNSVFQRFVKNESGVIAVFFAVAAIPLLYATALAVNYAQGNKVVASLQDAADAAALASVAPGIYNRSLSESAQQTASSNAAIKTFNAMVSPGVTITSTSLTTKINPYGMKGVFSYTASMPSGVMSSVMGSMSLSGGATAYAGRQTFEYVDLFILVDISQSMATGADLATQQKMNNDSQMDNCDFACHFSGSGDTVAMAARKGYKLRLDVVKEALTSLISQVKDATGDPRNTLRIGLYTFANDYTEVAALSSDFDALQTKVNNLSIAKYRSGTYFQGALNSLKSKIQEYNTPGRKKYVMLVTDGVSDSVVVNQSGSTVSYTHTANTNYSATTCWTETPSPDNPNSSGVPQGPFNVPTTNPVTSRPCVPDPYISATKKKGAHGGAPDFSLMGIDPNWCKGIKNIGVTMTTLYVEFGNLRDYSKTNTKDWFRNEWRYIFLNNYVIPNLPTYMSQCASSAGDAYTANDAASVQAAFDGIFGKYLSAPNVRLTH